MPDGGPFALRGERLFDGERFVDRPVVLVDAGRIVAAGVEPPESVLVTDLGAVTLLPGLVDTHQHLCFDGRGTLEEQVVGIDDATIAERSMAAARRALAGGVTTLRDLGDLNGSTLAMRGSPGMPTILAAGPPLTVPGGHCWYLGGECTTDDAALTRAVQDRFERGADVVKVMVTGGMLTPAHPTWMSQFSRTELKVIVDEAHRLGMPVAAHCHGIGGIRDALDVGADSIEHCTFLGPDGQPVVDDDLLARLSASESAISVTVGVTPGAVPPPAVAAVHDEVNRLWAQMCELGATVVPGTDAGVGLGKPHDVLSAAYGDLMSIGMTSTGALRSMTHDAAVVCGVGGRKGRLAQGFDADVVAVATASLQSDTLAVVDVWHGGVPVART